MLTKIRKWSLNGDVVLIFSISYSFEPYSDLKKKKKNQASKIASIAISQWDFEPEPFMQMIKNWVSHL